jgi:branched-chain amino acid transport system ATP-binding protein
VTEGRAPAVVVDQLTKRYGQVTAVDGISFEVEPGEVFALLGPNGAGKSTTLRMASGLLTPREGRVRLDGADVTGWSPNQRARRGMCHIFEGRGVFPSLTVRENLLMQTPRGVKEATVVERAFEAFPPLASRKNQVAGTLSGGEQQMLALVRAYVAEPRVVLVDEASLGLAPLVVDGIFDFLKRISDSGVSLLIVEQYIGRALTLAAEVYVLNQGEIVHQGPSNVLSEEEIFAMYSGHRADR